MQKIRYGAKLVDNLPADLAGFGCEATSLGGIGRVLQGAHIDLERGEALRRGVVQFAGEAAAFLVLQGHEPGGEASHLFLRILKTALGRDLGGDICGNPLASCPRADAIEVGPQRATEPPPLRAGVRELRDGVARCPLTPRGFEHRENFLHQRRSQHRPPADRRFTAQHLE